MTKESKFPCGICHKSVHDNQKAVFCNECNFYIHIKCNNMSVLEYEVLVNEVDDVPWFCINCTEKYHAYVFHFGSIENQTLLNISDFDKPSVVDSIPSFEITSHLPNLPNLQDYDIGEHLPSNIDSSYHTIQDLSTFDTSPTHPSLFHMNIRSLSCRFDKLQFLLVNLNIGFNVIAVSETWDSFARPLSANIEIPGFTFISSKSQSQNGGVGVYIKTSMGPVPRPDLDSDSDEYETVWAEIENSKDKNILICCAYRHPNTETECKI